MTEVERMLGETVDWSQLLPRLFVGMVAVVAIVAAVRAFARSAGRSARHEVHQVGSVYHCSCGEVFSSPDQALQHAERRLDEGRVTGRTHPQLGHPMR